MSATSHPNQELLANIYIPFARGDFDTAMASLPDDVEWHVHRPCPVAGTYRGKDAVLDWFPRMAALYEGTLRVDVPAILADDQHGYVGVTEHAERPAAGLAYRGIHRWKFRDGKCSRFESYYDDAYTAFWTGQSA